MSMGFCSKRRLTLRRARRACSTLAGEERVAVYVEGTGLLFTGCVGEGVDWRPDSHVDKSDLFEHLLPARTGQPACDSAGPKIDVAYRLRWNRTAVGDVGELEYASGSQ